MSLLEVTSRCAIRGYVNLQLLHRHCHDQKTAPDGSIAARRGTDHNSLAVEEPDDTNVSRPVLKPSDRGDPVA
jgi:RNA-directed DNA polymerase